MKKNPYTKIEKATKEEAAARILTDPYDEKLFFDEEQIDGSSGDWRKCPKWDISYRQKVTASDVYLQVYMTTPIVQCMEYFKVIFRWETKVQQRQAAKT